MVQGTLKKRTVECSIQRLFGSSANTGNFRELTTHQSTSPALPRQSPILGDGTQDPRVWDTTWQPLPTLANMYGCWGVQELRENINITTCDNNCSSDTTPGCVTQNHTTDPVARCWQTRLQAAWLKITQQTLWQDADKPQRFQNVSLSRISELRGLYRKCSHHKDNKTLCFEASFFSSENLSSQTIEWTAT
jgi:hypothetical protein